MLHNINPSLMQRLLCYSRIFVTNGLPYGLSYPPPPLFLMFTCTNDFPGFLAHEFQASMGAYSGEYYNCSFSAGLCTCFAMKNPQICERTTFSSLVAPAPDPPDESLGCISRTVRNRFSEVVVRKPISALGCRP